MDLSVAPALDLAADPAELTRRLCDLESVSGREGPLADGIEAALRAVPHLEVLRDGDAVVARTHLGHPERVVLAGHLDTVPIARRGDGTPNVPVVVERSDGGLDDPAPRHDVLRDDDVLHGRGTVDMKGGLAVLLHVAATVPPGELTRDITVIGYDNEEVDSEFNGLRRIAERHPDWLAADFAVLLEPTDGVVEGGCQGTLRAVVTTRGVAAHSARSWMGHNAIHDAARVLTVLEAYQPLQVAVDGLVYREGLNAVGVAGGVAGNVIPDECRVTVNFRFAPDRSAAEAERHVREVFDGFDVELVDVAAGARPGLTHPAAAAFVSAIGRGAAPKYGWTDVARFSELGVPAVNFGPGDPMLSHRDDERVRVGQVRECARALRRWLTTR